jgi:hypothetical protein
MVRRLVHWVKAKAPSDEPTVQFLVATFISRESISPDFAGTTLSLTDILET